MRYAKHFARLIAKVNKVEGQTNYKKFKFGIQVTEGIYHAYNLDQSSGTTLQEGQ